MTTMTMTTRIGGIPVGELILAGLQVEVTKAEAAVEEIRQQLGQSPATAAKPATATATAPKQKRTMSASARKRIAAAQRKRWAEYYRTHPKR